MNKAYKYRLYPNDLQKALINKTFGCTRFIWNQMLFDANQYYNTNKSLHINTPASYKSKYIWLREVDSLALANVQMNLNKAFKQYFNDLSKKSRNKRNHPKFKSKKHSKYSYTTNCVNSNIEVLDNCIKLPKLGYVKAVVHRDVPDNYILKSVTVSQDVTGNYYASVLYEFDVVININYQIDVTKAIGLDYKSDGLYHDSNNHIAGSPKHYRKNQKKLRRVQRCLSRRIGSRKNEIKSNNYYKQLHKVNKIHRHISNARKDYLHKLSAEITNQYDIICIETLDMKAMSNKGFHNGKATLDNGFGMFVNMLDYKQFDKHHVLIKVDKWYPSSKTCNVCKYIKSDLQLQDRYWICPSCGTSHDRDYNASRNILEEGLRLFALA